MKPNLLFITLFFITLLVSGQEDHGSHTSGSQNIVTSTVKTVVIRNQGFTFTPKDTTIELGDTIRFSIGGSHDAVQVSMQEWEANGNTPLANGFSVSFGGGKVVLKAEGTYYYVCTPHASLSMKGIIRVKAATTPKSAKVEVKNVGLTFVPAEITIKPGDSVKFTIASSHDVKEVEKGTWDANGNTPLANGFSTPFGGGTVVFKKAGIYYYVCTPHASRGMKGIIRVEDGKPIKVEVKNQGLTFVPADISIKPGDTIKFTLGATHDVKEVSQTTWDAGGNSPLANGFSTPFGGGTVIINKEGLYYYVCTPHAALGMKGIIRVSTGISTAIQPNILKQFAVEAYPSPVNDFMQVKIFSPINVEAGIVVRDLTGRVVKSQKQLLIAGQNKAELVLDQVEAGIYLISIEAAGSSAGVLKIVKE